MSSNRLSSTSTTGKMGKMGKEDIITAAGGAAAEAEAAAAEAATEEKAAAAEAAAAAVAPAAAAAAEWRQTVSEMHSAMGTEVDAFGDGFCWLYACLAGEMIAPSHLFECPV